MNYMRKSKEEAIFYLFYKVSKFLQEWKKKYTTILNSLKKRAKQIQKKKTNKQKNSIITKLDLFYECKIG